MQLCGHENEHTSLAVVLRVILQKTNNVTYNVQTPPHVGLKKAKQNGKKIINSGGNDNIHNLVRIKIADVTAINFNPISFYRWKIST